MTVAGRWLVETSTHVRHTMHIPDGRYNVLLLRCSQNRTCVLRMAVSAHIRESNCRLCFCKSVEEMSHLRMACIASVLLYAEWYLLYVCHANCSFQESWGSQIVASRATSSHWICMIFEWFAFPWRACFRILFFLCKVLFGYLILHNCSSEFRDSCGRFHCTKSEYLYKLAVSDVFFVRLRNV